jgi:DNA modification methylase
MTAIATTAPDAAVGAEGYAEFLERKVRFSYAYGHDVDLDDVNANLVPHQRDLVRWAVAGGRRAIFASFGLGKSVMQLETLRLTLEAHVTAAQVRDRHDRTAATARALIVCPLGVKQEFQADAEQVLEIEPPRFVRRSEEVDGPGIYITNYESVRDGKLDVNLFTAVSLDEASVLRSFGSKTYQTFLDLFDQVPYRFVATATPSPNRYKELIHYAGFLGIMDTGQSLTRFFQRDSTQANNLTLYPHKEREFWLWLNTWAAFVQSPADLGHDATGYDLPPLVTHWHEVPVDHALAETERDGQGVLYRGGLLDLRQAAAEKRRTLADRVAVALDLVAEHVDDGQVIIWCDLNDEQAALERGLADLGITYSSVHGSLDLDEAEARLAAWKRGETHALIGKPVMLGQGMNLQQSRRCVFVGIDQKFNKFIQAIHRTQRFGQTRECHAHFVYAESETEIRADLLAKWDRHRELVGTMTDVIRAHGLNATSVTDALVRSMGVERVEVRSSSGAPSSRSESSGTEAGMETSGRPGAIVPDAPLWTAVHNDTVDETSRMATDSVDLIVTSIPFANHYEYTPSYNDFGHTDDNEHFWAQMDYLTPQLRRVLAPGRIYACHVKDRINFGSVTGAGLPTVSPFHAEAIHHGIKHGFDYMGMITVVTDVVRENNQTYRLSWSEQCKDATKMGVGSPEYVLLFHKPQSDRSKGYADTPVTKPKDGPDGYTRARWQIDAHAFWRSSGNRLLTVDELAALPVEDRSRLFTEQTLREVYDYEHHVELGEILDDRNALPATFMSLAPGSADPFVWHDVNRMRTLNGEQTKRAQTNHVCPLQFDIVDRLIHRFSNVGDLVYDPFAGLMTVPLRAIKAARRGYGTELNTGYHRDGVAYLRAEERAQDAPALFDLLEVEADTSGAAS